jgi:formylmethanofuran dehydrogenase subunit A
VRLQRLHVVDLPLTPYLRYELSAYDMNVEAGEEILVADRAWHPDLAELTQDFALFDAETSHPSVVWMHYDAVGKPGEYDYTEDPADVARGIHLRDVALARAVPLEEFRALIKPE